MFMKLVKVSFIEKEQKAGGKGIGRARVLEKSVSGVSLKVATEQLVQQGGQCG